MKYIYGDWGDLVDSISDIQNVIINMKLEILIYCSKNWKILQKLILGSNIINLSVSRRGEISKCQTRMSKLVWSLSH